jgi:hypothetical protein
MRVRELCEACSRLRRSYPGKRLFVILDNVKDVHDHPLVLALMRRLRTHPIWPGRFASSSSTANVQPEVDWVTKAGNVCCGPTQAGARLARHPARERTRLDALIANMNVAYPNEKYVEIFADTFAALERRGARAPAMDLLSAPVKSPR